MKQLFILLSIGLSSISYGQILTLDQCQRMAIDYSTLRNQRNLHSDISESKRKTLNSAYLPQADVNAQATYQSDVIALPFSMLGVDIPVISKDQYRATIDLRQMIYDGGYVSSQKRVVEASLQVENYKLDIMESDLKDKVSSIYLGILLLDENINILKMSLSTLSNNIKKMNDGVREGVALRINLDVLETEYIKIEQKITESASNRVQLVQLLNSITGSDAVFSSIFAKPEVILDPTSASQRVEYHLFDAQVDVLDSQNKIINSKNLPKINAFANGGYGRPGLNMMSNDFASIFVVGAKVSVPLTGWTSTRHEKQSIRKQQELIREQREEFTRKNSAEIESQLAEIEKFKTLIISDKQIIDKYEDITASQQQRMLNGVITANDYISDLNSHQQVILNQKLHELQLTQTLIKLNSLKGNN